jgi:hypothetical protein
MNTEALSAYLQIHLSSNHFLNSKAEINDRMTEIIKVLQEIKITVNYMKNTKYIKDMK